MAIKAIMSKLKWLKEFGKTYSQKAHIPKNPDTDTE